MRSIVLLLFCPILILSALIEWGQIAKVSDNSHTKRFSVIHHCQATNVTHIFWEELGSDNDYHLLYRARLSTGELTEKKLLSAKPPLPEFYNQISVQSAEDGKQILLAYGGYRRASSKGCTTRNDASCIEIYFTESLDGGANWKAPARVNRTEQEDLVHRSMPSMALEKDTGRVYITYLYNMYSAMQVRDPGKLIFNPEKQLSVYTFSMTMNMGYTISRKDGKRYLHLVWYENDGHRARSIYYSRSEDGGQTWTRRIVLAKQYKGEGVPSLAIDTEAAEGGVYVQYWEERVVRILWSKDHGATWGERVTIKKALYPNDAITICGGRDKGRVFTMNHGLGPIAGNFKYFETSAAPSVVSLRYPFNGFKAAKNPSLHCAKGTQGEFVLAASILDPSNNEIYMVRGVLNG
eukprot:TRINITY_DN9005_c0_g2_i4.p1 TRINITY_DN9005_c0_g2~~TRINITY_DN9005_c0_g2_i4.p1  ORF type:complete len:407 (+),score=75.08 TRINITY_DN9005_c0_g2_i4:72-1292(+)